MIVLLTEKDYFTNDWFDPQEQGSEAFFCTRRRDFGGFSFASLRNNHVPIDRIHQTGLLAQINPDQGTWREVARQIMTEEILKVSQNNGFRNIVVNNFIHLLTISPLVAQGIADAINAWKGKYPEVIRFRIRTGMAQHIQDAFAEAGINFNIY